MGNITAREFFLNTFKHDFLTDEEKETIISAIELYSTGVKNQLNKATAALKRIEQMSDNGNYATTIVNMKSIATEILKL